MAASRSGRTHVDVQVVGVPEPEPERSATAPDQLHLFAALESPLPELAALAAVPPPPAVTLRRISYSGLALYDRCSYRYYAQRVLRLPERVAERPDGGGMAGVEIGDAVHLLLERADERWRERYPHATAEDEAAHPADARQLVRLGAGRRGCAGWTARGSSCRSRSRSTTC